ncbi:MAG: sugar transporter [Pseudomonadota bacterium]
MARKNTIVTALREERAKGTAKAGPSGKRDAGEGPRAPGPRPGTEVQEERALAPDELAPQPPAPLPDPHREPDTGPQTQQSGASRASRDVAPAAGLKRRHWGQALSFAAFVCLPLVIIAIYLFAIAEDQYASTTGFTVQREEGAVASDFLGISAALIGGSTASDTDVLYEFIRSQDIVERIDARLDLRSHYAQHWEGGPVASDKVFSLWPDATIEDVLRFWARTVRISYDQSTGLIEVRVTAFDPEFAREVARAVVDESQTMINALSRAAQEDATRYALADLQEALARLKDAREALTVYRTITQIVDPLADLESRLGVMNSLQQQLAQALINFDLLRETTGASDPRVAQAERRISAIRERIISERQTFASDDSTTGAVGEDYPTLIAEFERLTVDLEYGEQSYRAALAAYDLARENAARQSRYLATYVEPTLAQSAEFPRRWMLFGLAALFLVLAWSIVILIYYSIRDRR